MSTWMRHPDLDSGQVIEVAEMSAAHYASAGWVVTDPPPPAPRPESEDSPAPAEAVASVPEPKTASTSSAARRATKEAEQK